MQDVNRADLPTADHCLHTPVARGERLAFTKRQLINDVACNPVGGNVQPNTPFACTVVRVFGGASLIEVPNVSGPDPGEIVVETVCELPPDFRRQGMILVAGTIRYVGD